MATVNTPSSSKAFQIWFARAKLKDIGPMHGWQFELFERHLAKAFAAGRRLGLKEAAQPAPPLK